MVTKAQLERALREDTKLSSSDNRSNRHNSRPSINSNQARSSQLHRLCTTHQPLTSSGLDQETDLRKISILTTTAGEAVEELCEVHAPRATD